MLGTRELRMTRVGAGFDCFCVRAALFLSFAFGIAASFSFSLAQTPGVTDNRILIGSCSALDGPARILGNQTVLGATIYLHSINLHSINLHSINDEGGAPSFARTRSYTKSCAKRLLPRAAVRRSGRCILRRSLRIETINQVVNS
jgi:hypothetical protein